MQIPREHRAWWLVAAGAAVVVAIVAIVLGVSASSAGVNSLDGSGAESENGDVSNPPDAATVGLDTDPSMQDQETTEYVPNEVLVSIDDPSVLDQLVPGAALANGTIVAVEQVTEGSDGTGGVVKITFEGDATEDDVVDALNSMGGVTAQKNFVYHLM